MQCQLLTTIRKLRVCWWRSFRFKMPRMAGLAFPSFTHSGNSASVWRVITKIAFTNNIKKRTKKDTSKTANIEINDVSYVYLSMGCVNPRVGLGRDLSLCDGLGWVANNSIELVQRGMRVGVLTHYSVYWVSHYLSTEYCTVRTSGTLFRQ
jgi:hypothetical protein